MTSRRRILVLGAAFVLGGLVLLAVLPADSRQVLLPAVEPGLTFTVSGYYRSGTTYLTGVGGCAERVLPRDFHDGAPVTVTDDTGAVLGRSELSRGYGLDPLHNGGCGWAFFVSGVPADRARYHVYVGSGLGGSVAFVRPDGFLRLRGLRVPGDPWYVHLFKPGFTGPG